MSASSYSSVIRGKLQLKGRGAKVLEHHQSSLISSALQNKRKAEADSSSSPPLQKEDQNQLKDQDQIQKQKEKKRKRNKPEDEEEQETNSQRPDKTSELDSNHSASIASSSAPAVDSRTRAQRAFDEVQAKKESDLIAKRISKSHRQQIEEYNAKLADLSEHHDIPKVGPG